jgi:hypothetical protein
MLESDGHITNPASGKCLDLKGGIQNKGNGAELILNDHQDSPSQKFIFLGDGHI